MATIANIQDHGTIILVTLSNGDVVPFDHRMFSHFCEAYEDEHGKVDLRGIEFEFNPEMMTIQEV